MPFLLLLLLIMTALAMLCWGLKQRNGLLIFPTLAAGAWLFYVVPQMVGIMANPGLLPTEILRDGGLEITLWMCSACAALSFVGYYMRPAVLMPRRAHVRTIEQYSHRRLFQAGLLLAVVGLGGFYGLTSLSGGVQAFYSTEHGGYAMEWSGTTLIYAWFLRMGGSGMVLCLVVTLHRPTQERWAGLAFAAFIPVVTILLAGRREGTFNLALIALLSLYFTRRKVPPRWLLVPAVVAAFLVVQLAPTFRTHFRFGADVSRLGEMDPMGAAESVFRGESGVKESEYAIIQIAATNKAGRFNYGVRFYNAIVNNWVPRQIFGDAFKTSLFLSTANHSGYMQQYYARNRPTGCFPTGYMDAFREFWLFGSLVFFLMGAAFRALWEQAERGSLASQLFYISIAHIALTSVVKGVTGVPSHILFLCLCLVPPLLWARIGVAGRRLRAPRGQRPAGTGRSRVLDATEGT